MALFCLEKQCLGIFRGFFVVFSWLFRGPRFGQNLRVLALEQFSDLRVMDVRAENHGRPHQKVRFPAAPVVGRNFLTPGHPGVRVIRADVPG